MEFAEVTSVRRFLLFSGSQQIAVDGHIDPDGEQNLVVSFDEIEIGSFSDLLGYDGVHGVAEGYLMVMGAADDLDLESSIRIDSMSAVGYPVGDLRIEGSYSNRKLNLSSQLDHPGGSNVSSSGFLPLDLTLGSLQPPEDHEPVGFTIEVDTMPTNWLQPFLDEKLKMLVKNIR